MAKIDGDGRTSVNKLTIKHADSWRMVDHHEHTCQSPMKKAQERTTRSNVAIVAVSLCLATGIVMVGHRPHDIFIVQNV